MPDDAPNINTSQTIGKGTKYVAGIDWESYTEQLDFYFLANKVSEAKNEEGCSFDEPPSGNLPIGEGFRGSCTTEGRRYNLRCHCTTNAGTTQTLKIGLGRTLRVR